MLLLLTFLVIFINDENIIGYWKTTAGLKTTLVWVSSSTLYTCDVNIAWNNILNIPWCHFFPSPDFYFSRNGLDTNKPFSVLSFVCACIFGLRVHQQILTDWWIIMLQWIGLRVGDSIRPKVTIFQTNIKLPRICLV